MLRPGEGTTPTGEWGDWLSPAAAWARVVALWQPAATEAEEVALRAAHGRVLAVDQHASADSPAFDRSAVDGYALRAADVTPGAVPAMLAVVGSVPMGAASDVSVGAGQAAWVATGSMLPAGADAVVMVERTERDDERVRVLETVAPGDNVVRRGDDLRAGDLVLRAGRLLQPRDLAALASMGLARVPVRRRPRVAIISGGDELVTPGQPLAPGQIYDSNSYAMAAQIESWGGEPVVLPRVADDAAAVRDALARGIELAEVVLLSGGSSVGLKDLTAETIDHVAEAMRAGSGDLTSPGVLVHGVAMRPARPTIIGVVGGRLVVGIPGNPVSAMIACEVFARPALELLLGLSPVRTAGTMGEHSVRGRLASAVRSQAGRQDYTRVRVERTGDAITVHPVRGGSNAIRSMVEADGLVVVPPEVAALEAGAEVEVWLF